MKEAPFPQNEQSRLESLYSYNLLNTLPEQDYDNITRLASAICNTPISLITLVDEDRQWFKSAHGLAEKQTRREYAFCAHAILNPEEIMIVPDAQKDERFADNPLVTGYPHVIFYAGVPITTPDGHALGSLCVIDNKPGNLTTEQIDGLKTLAGQVMRLMELQKSNAELLQNRRQLEEINKELKKFAQIVANDLQKPCNTLSELTDLVIEKYGEEMNVDGMQILTLLKYTAENMKTTIGNTMKRTQAAQLNLKDKSLFTFTALMEELKSMLPQALHPMLQYEPSETSLYAFKKTVLHALLCFVSNGIGFNDSQDKKVKITCDVHDDVYLFTVADNGHGLPVIQRNGSFEIFGSDKNEDKKKYAEYISNLNQARQLVTQLHGTIEVAFEEGSGAEYTFSVCK